MVSPLTNKNGNGLLLFCICLFFIALFWLTPVRYLYQNYFMNYDQISNIQMLNDTLRQGYPSSSMHESVLMTQKYWYNVPASEIPITGIAIQRPYFNNFLYHTYFILYLLVPFAKIFGASMTLAGASVAIACAMILVPLWTLRQRGVPWVLTLFFCLAVAVHQHTLGVILGQFYLDRLIIPFFLLCLVSLDRDPEQWLLPFLFGLLAAACREEAGFYIALTIALYLTLHRKLSFKGLLIVIFFGTL